MKLFHILSRARICLVFKSRLFVPLLFYAGSRITVVTMAGAPIAINDAAAADSILSVKERVFAANRTLFVRRQRLVYSAGPRGMDALADDETLGGAGVAQDGSAELDVLLADLTAAEAAELDEQVLRCFGCFVVFSLLFKSRLPSTIVSSVYFAVLVVFCWLIFWIHFQFVYLYL